MPEDIRSADEFFDAVKLCFISFKSEYAREATAMKLGFADANEMGAWYKEELDRRSDNCEPSPRWSVYPTMVREDDELIHNGNYVVAGKCQSFNFGTQGFHVVISEKDLAELKKCLAMLEEGDV